MWFKVSMGKISRREVVLIFQEGESVWTKTRGRLRGKGSSHSKNLSIRSAVQLCSLVLSLSKEEREGISLFLFFFQFLIWTQLLQSSTLNF